MKVTCYGPRGSIPSPSTHDFSTVEYGGDTSCYYVEAGPFRIILDCGSGIRRLGNELMAKGQGFGSKWIVLLSHYHWDHLQGLPFAVPMFIPSNEFFFHGFAPSGHEHGPMPVVEHMLEHQQSNPHFPVAHGAMPSKKDYTDHPRQFSETFWYIHNTNDDCYYSWDAEPESGRLAEGTTVLKVTTIPLNHPDGCLGFRIEYEGKVLVYATDNEPLRHPNAQLTKHGHGADLIILDGQYTEEQVAGAAQTFGHGTPHACLEQAEACEARSLVIHHHDPNNDDDKLRAMEDQVKQSALSIPLTGQVQVEFARQGRCWIL